MSGFSGVKRAEFDLMAGKHTEAAGRLEALAQALHRELQGAGLDTAPAARLRELARRVTTQADDLRRRQNLAHELQRQRVSLGRSTPAGSFVEMPDRLDDAKALLDGTLAGRAASKVADGDDKALADLEKYASRTGDSEFVKAFLGAIGARGVTRMSGSLATMLRDAVTRGDSDRKNRLSTSGRNVLTTLSSILAKGTNRKNSSYQGDGFLADLVKEGRAQHGADGGKYLGYQALALIWRAHDGEPPYSKEFMEVVGRDVIVYEREQREDAWAASKDALGRAFGGAQVPIVDLAGSLGLGALLRWGVSAKDPITEKPSSMVESLFHAAKSSREASHALLDHTPPGWDESVLEYLLTTRWGASQYLDDYEPINGMLITATTGQDETSKKQASEMIRVLSHEVRDAFGKDAYGNLKIRDREAFDRYLPLNYPLARAIAANVDEISNLVLNHADFYGVAAKDMAHALVVATSDDKGFEVLARAQTEHMRAALATAVPPIGLNASNAERFGFTKAEVKRFDMNENGRVDRDDILHFLGDRAKAEARSFGFIMEIRRQALIAQGLDDNKADEALTSMVRDAIGLIPVPGAKHVGTLAAGAFGEIASKGYEMLAGLTYDELARHVAKQASEQVPSLDKAHQTLAENRLAVDRLAEQMLATASLSKGMLDGQDLENVTFTVGIPPRLKPFTEMNSQEYSSFLKWSRKAGGIESLYTGFRDTFRTTSDVNDYLNLKIPSESEGGQ
ncbi:hypothetical protein [Nonomuraea ferruginea]|uniref:EF-hand domain-containing protein n=1 Tax=Nonomuraea ferruginea TaxID=46174 RepID=A0ABT4T219_9ACTN|nr:hypothetical protein [Nonomuraea ferruginea]MDA0643527.1 hypothetical protein [Nonomuraea ferruginea]